MSPRSTVSFTVSVTPADGRMSDLLERHLQAALSARGVALCRGVATPMATSSAASAGASPSLGTISLELEQDPASHRAVAHIRVGVPPHAVHLERTLELADIPVEGRALAVASAADELWRASWTNGPEGAASEAPSTSGATTGSAAGSMRAAASASTGGSRVSARSSKETKPALAPRAGQGAGTVNTDHVAKTEGSLLFHTSMFARRTAVGGDLLLDRGLSSNLGVLFRVSGSLGLSWSSPSGATRMDQEGLYLGLGYAPWGRGAKFGARFEGMLGALATQISATPTAVADARPAIDWSLVSHLGARFWLGPPTLRATAGLALLYGLRPVLATDSGAPTTSNEGIGTEVSVGVSLRL